MTDKLLKQLKQKLEENKASIEKELKTFAKKDPKMKGDWDTIFPKLADSNIEEAAEEVEQYSTRLPVEYSLELKLKDIETALQKINKTKLISGSNKIKYGICEKCGKTISIERLKIYPEAKTCQKCHKN